MLEKQAIIYVFEFNRGLKWAAEIFFPHVARNFSPVLVSKTFYKDIFKLVNAAEKNLSRLGIKNMQVARIEGLTTIPQYTEFLRKYSGVCEE